jgi:DNA polymerase-3 subunit beta
MEIRITKKSLVSALARTSTISDRKSSMQIISNVLIDAADKDRVRISATDLNLFATGVFPAEVVEEGSITVPAKAMYDVVRNMPEGFVTVRTEDEHVRISSGRTYFRLFSLSADGFPVIPDISSVQFFDVNTILLKQMIKQTSFSISQDKTRSSLNGSLFHGDGKNISMVTTDGHRLSKVEFRVEDSGFYDFSMVIPIKAIVEIGRLVDDGDGSISIGINDGSVFFRRMIDLDSEDNQKSLVAEQMIASKLIEKKFPPYDQVIPKSNDMTIIVYRVPLLEALKRVAVISEEKAIRIGVRFELSDGVIKIDTNNPSIGHGSEQVDVSYDGDPVTICFNARYLIDILNVLHDDEVKLEISGPLDPFVVKDLNDLFTGVVMPMRI